MKWVEKLLLFIFGLVLLLQRDIEAVSVVALILAFSVGCFGGYFKKSLYFILSGAAWMAAGMFFPLFCVFWPLVLYDAVRKRIFWLAVLPAASFIAAAGYFAPLETAVLALAAAASFLLALREQRAEQLLGEVKRIRDASREATLLLDEKNRALKEKQDYEIRIATLTERGRIAREIHDNVGHMLARAMLQTGAIRAVVKEEQTAAQLSGLNETLTGAMNSVRESVHGLRDESFDLQGMIETSMRDFSEVSCSLHFDMEKYAPQSVKYCFAAVVREAFSNVVRHSDATRVNIDVQEHPAFFRLRFSDNGTVQKSAAEAMQAGMGLDNMRERVQSLGGQLNINREKGFHIHITIPKNKAGEGR
ncbi:MAG: sensor histidine kinase [Christensenellaceae bacterium]|jgi:signal transduction histidine kinase